MVTMIQQRVALLPIPWLNRRGCNLLLFQQQQQMSYSRFTGRSMNSTSLNLPSGLRLLLRNYGSVSDQLLLLSRRVRVDTLWSKRNGTGLSSPMKYYGLRTSYISTTTGTITTTTTTTSSNSWRLYYYALGGWIFFIAENTLLSENRTAIISYLEQPSSQQLQQQQQQQPREDTTVAVEMDESKYRMIYGTISTIATASILYGYRQLRIINAATATAMMKKGTTVMTVVLPTTTTSRFMITTFAISMMSLGLIFVSQAFPKLQIPIERSLVPTAPSSSSSSSSSVDQSVEKDGTLVHTTTASSTDSNSNTIDTDGATPGGGFSWKVRCPFDFADSKKDGTGTDDEIVVRGIDRITRHSGLWSLAFIGLGNAVLQPSLGLSLFMTGPFLVAWIGGYHHDSRLQRHMGGSFPSKTYEQQTSNVPFLAMILGQQREQNFINSLTTLVSQEIKLLNATVAIILATLYVTMNKGRNASFIGHILSSLSSHQRIAAKSTPSLTGKSLYNNINNKSPN